MFRTTTLATATTALAALALAAPGGAAAASIDAAATLEAHAVADSGQALSLARSSAARAKRAVADSSTALRRAYAITVAQGTQSSGRGLDAAAQFSAAAQLQSDRLADVVERAHGGLRTAAAQALARTGRMEAELAARVAHGLEQQSSTASAQQGQDVAEVGGAQAEVTASVAAAASDDGLLDRVQAGMDRVTSSSVAAQARLLAAVADLRERTEGQSGGSMTTAQTSLRDSMEDLVGRLRSSGRWEVDYEKSVETGDGLVSASARVQAHASVDAGGRR